jgi:single-strand DNA-binding protein
MVDDKMSMSVNKVTLIGNLGRDPDIRFMPDGSRVVSFSLATSEAWKDKVTGEKKDRTEWHRVVAFSDRIAEICEKHVKKGSRLYIEGQLQTRKWTDASGVEKYTTEVVLSRFRGDIMLIDGRRSDGEHHSDTGGQHAHFDNVSANIPLDDDIPF